MADIVRRDPFRSLFAWPRWFDDFEDAFPTTTSQRGFRIHEDNKNIYVEAVVAGVPAKKVDIEIEDGVVTIKAERAEEEKSKKEYKASSYSYYYTCALSGGQWDKAEAEIEDGVVTISIPKTKATRPKKVRIKAKNA